MNEAEAIESCPALAQALQDYPTGRAALDRLLAGGLGGVFKKFLSDASPQALVTFLQELERVDFERVTEHQELVRHAKVEALRSSDVEPVPLVTLEEQQERLSADSKAGLESLSRGEWASVAFSGGAGTRFFSELDKLDKALASPNEALKSGEFKAGSGEPKGVFPITPVAGLSFYEIFIAEALACGVRCSRLPRVLLLTSSRTHEQTTRFLSGSDLWGFPAEGWVAFRQTEEPRLDTDQDLIITDQAGHLCWTGDGHGGVYRALLTARESGDSLLDELSRLGVRHLVMHNVDNPAARPFDPARLGFHVGQQALFTVSAVRKTDPEEKVGLLMLMKSSGKVEVVEYNVLDADLAGARDPGTGRLLHEAGNTNTNLIAVEAVTRDIQPTIYTGKQVTSKTGQIPSSSIEMLNQHITRLLDPTRVRAFEVPRPDFFMPTKNVVGADSVESTTRLLSETFTRQLEQAGAEVAPDAIVDLHPACGASGEELAALGIGPGWKLGEGARLYLCLRQGDPQGAPVADGHVELEPGSTLLLDAARPYGDIRLDRLHNVDVDAAQASCVRVGRGVVIKQGVRVAFHIGPGARLTIPPGRVIDRDMEGEVEPGGDLEL
jgi:UDP-N-acetylglucosamine/UDP-N-acetylgalactosamine diphosphorylase